MMFAERLRTSENVTRLAIGPPEVRTTAWYEYIASCQIGTQVRLHTAMLIRQNTVATKELIILHHTVIHVILSVIIRSIWTARLHYPCCGSDAMTWIICVYLRPTQVSERMRVFERSD